MKAMILGMLTIASCMVNEPTVSSETQNFQTVCDWDQDGNPIYCTGGGDSGGGGGFPDNVCASVSQNCDPMFRSTYDLLCASWCSDASARCQASYACPTGSDLPVCHLGYCADWR